jgi:hypothetical protein
MTSNRIVTLGKEALGGYLSRAGLEWHRHNIWDDAEGAGITSFVEACEWAVMKATVDPQEIVDKVKARLRGAGWRNMKGIAANRALLGEVLRETGECWPIRGASGAACAHSTWETCLANALLLLVEKTDVQTDEEGVA